MGAINKTFFYPTEIKQEGGKTMIQFHHKGKIVCSMPLENLTIPQMLMGRELVAQKLKVSKSCIDFKCVEEGS